MTQEEKLRHEGWCQALNSVTASLKMYPNGGGDIQIMQEVERIEKAAFERGLQQASGNIDSALNKIRDGEI